MEFTINIELTPENIDLVALKLQYQPMIKEKREVTKEVTVRRYNDVGELADVIENIKDYEDVETPNPETKEQYIERMYRLIFNEVIKTHIKEAKAKINEEEVRDLQIVK